MPSYSNCDEYPWYSQRNNATTLSISNSVTSIGDYAFLQFLKLTSVSLGTGLTSIGKYAFQYCNFTSVTIPAGVTSAYGAFANTSVQSMTLTNGMTVIPERMCHSCTSLTSITIPSTVKRIESEAFTYTSLTSITIPASVEYINPNAFGGHFSFGSLNSEPLTTINVDGNNSYYSSDANGVLYNKNKSAIVRCPPATTMTSFTIPESVTSIGDYAFRDCSGINSITLPSNLTTIGNYAFSDCSSLQGLTLPNNLTTIGNLAFSYCSSLTSITLPSNLTTIGNSAFDNCNSLSGIIVDENNAYYSNYNNDGVLYNKAITSIIAIPEGKTVYTVPNTITTITGYELPSKLTMLTIPASVTTLGSESYFGTFFNSNCQIVFLYSTESEIPTLDSYDLYHQTVYVPNSLRAEYIRKWNIESSQSSVIGYNSISLAGSGVTTVTPTSTSETYTGTEIRPAVNVTLGTATLNLDDKTTTTHNFAGMSLPSSGYSTGYSNNLNVGTATVSVTGSGLFTGAASATGSFEITKADFANVTTTGSIVDQDYTGSALMPAIPTFTFNEQSIAAGDKTFTVGYSDNTAVGEATVTLIPTANGNFTGDAKTLHFNILRALGITFAAGRNWATYYAAEDLAKPDNMNVYAVTGVSNNAVTLQALEYIPANVGVLLSYESAGSDFKASKYTGVTSSYTSLLDGSTTGGLTVPAGSYILYNNEFVLATGSSTLAANRCYLSVNSNARQLAIGNDGATGIDASLVDSENGGEWYAVDGQKYNRKPTKKGVYVVDGKKVVIK